MLRDCLSTLAKKCCDLYEKMKAAKTFSPVAGVGKTKEADFPSIKIKE